MEGRESISSLKFLNYIVNNVTYKASEKINDNITWKLIFDIKNTTKVNNEKNKMCITLNVGVFKDVENAPFHMEVEATGYFALEGNDDILKYEANAIAIMYPYLRAIVSNYTASANISPVILPAINVNAMLTRKKEQEEKKD